MPVPNTFADQSGNVAAAELDENFDYLEANSVQTNAVNTFTARQIMSGAPYDWDKGDSIASAATLNLQTVTGNYLTVSGTNTMTAVTLNEGAWRMVRATGAFTWTNNSAIVVQGATNYVANVGDLFLVIGDEGGVVYVLVFPATGVGGITPIGSGGTGQSTSVTAFDALSAQGSDISSGATVNLATATGPYVNINGSGGPITSLGTATAGVQRTVKFASTPVITHNGTSLILPGGANITAAANDTACFISLGSGNWICAWYKRQSGVALAGLGAQSASSVAITGGAIDGVTIGGSSAGDGTFLDVTCDTATDAVGRLQAVPRSTSGALGNMNFTINTTNKFQGKLVINTTTGAFVTANGAGDTDPWLNLDGTTAFTPS